MGQPQPDRASRASRASRGRPAARVRARARARARVHGYTGTGLRLGHGQPFQRVGSGAARTAGGGRAGARAITGACAGLHPARVSTRAKGATNSSTGSAGTAQGLVVSESRCSGGELQPSPESCHQALPSPTPAKSSPSAEAQAQSRPLPCREGTCSASAMP